SFFLQAGACFSLPPPFPKIGEEVRGWDPDQVAGHDTLSGAKRIHIEMKLTNRRICVDSYFIDAEVEESMRRIEAENTLQRVSAARIFLTFLG
ncbi:MAG: hypothetical protein ACOY58_04960, partial [Candidatus Micrarchaeota archaeon]